MTRPHGDGNPTDPPACYELPVQGVLDNGWSAGSRSCGSPATGPLRPLSPAHSPTRRCCTACSPRSATWACRCSRPARSTPTDPDRRPPCRSSTPRGANLEPQADDSSAGRPHGRAVADRAIRSIAAAHPAGCCRTDLGGPRCHDTPRHLGGARHGHRRHRAVAAACAVLHQWGRRKLAGASIARADAKRLGFTYSTYQIVGALELAAAAGLVALTIGAVLAHRRARDPAAKLAGAGVIAVLALVTSGLQVLANT
jgi:hypothetical protein